MLGTAPAWCPCCNPVTQNNSVGSQGGGVGGIPLLPMAHQSKAHHSRTLCKRRERQALLSEETPGSWSQEGSSLWHPSQGWYHTSDRQRRSLSTICSDRLFPSCVLNYKCRQSPREPAYPLAWTIREPATRWGSCVIWQQRQTHHHHLYFQWYPPSLLGNSCW